jgi:hypothetical protein
MGLASLKAAYIVAESNRLLEYTELTRAVGLYECGSPRARHGAVKVAVELARNWDYKVIATEGTLLFEPINPKTREEILSKTKALMSLPTRTND